jgi:5-hydroxyisourate hydrolase-like protein (transthyretin family)
MRRNNNFNNKKQNINDVNLLEVSNEQPPSISQPTIGFLAVGVFTALGALPVKNASITVYSINENKEENVIHHRITDDSGRIPDMELNVFYDPQNPFVSKEFYFSTYNLRVQAQNYYPQNIQNFRVFPGVKTNLKINLIPLIQGYESQENIVIPPSPIDISH